MSLFHGYKTLKKVTWCDLYSQKSYKIMLSNLNGLLFSPCPPAILVILYLLLLYYNDILAMLNSLSSLYLPPGITCRFQFVKSLPTDSNASNSSLSHSCDSEGRGWGPIFCISDKLPKTLVLQSTTPNLHLGCFPVFSGVTL